MVAHAAPPHEAPHWGHAQNLISHSSTYWGAQGPAASGGGSLVGYKPSYAVPLFERSDVKRVPVVLVLRNFSENFPKL